MAPRLLQSDGEENGVNKGVGLELGVQLLSDLHSGFYLFTNSPAKARKTL